MPARFVTIPFSHYCEKARWALDRAGIDYVEEPHLPMFAWAPALRAGRRRTVPVLVLEDEVVADSHDILLRAHRFAPELGLYPDDITANVTELETVFDRKVGPAARRLAYAALMRDGNDPIRALFSVSGPRWEVAAARVALPAMVQMMKRGLKIDDEGVARSEESLAKVLRELEVQLEKSGGPWLFGARFTAADLTFASLFGPLAAPPEIEIRIGPCLTLDGPARGLIERYRDTIAGRFVLSAYAKERGITAAR